MKIPNQNLLVCEIEKEDAKVEKKASDTDDEEVDTRHLEHLGDNHNQLEHLGKGENHILDAFSPTLPSSWHQNKIYMFSQEAS